jgi:ParB/RepB/Spo0J family partition protein
MSQVNDDTGVRFVSMVDIHADPSFNCRGLIKHIDVMDLAQDIKIRGLAQPVVAMEYGSEEECKEDGYNTNGRKYLLIAGYRRHAAHELNNNETIKASIVPHMPRPEAMVYNLSENLQRKDLDMLGEAKVIKQLMDMGYRETDICRMLPGKNRGWIQVRCMMLQLPLDLQKDANEKRLTLKNIRSLNTILKSKKIPDEEDRMRILRAAAGKMLDAKAKGVTLKHDPADEFSQKKGRKINGRSRAQIINAINDIMDQGMPPGLWSICLAWSASSITNDDFYKEVAKTGDKLGITIQKPLDLI